MRKLILKCHSQVHFITPIWNFNVTERGVPVWKTYWSPTLSFTWILGMARELLMENAPLCQLDKDEIFQTKRDLYWHMTAYCCWRFANGPKPSFTRRSLVEALEQVIKCPNSVGTLVAAYVEVDESDVLKQYGYPGSEDQWGLPTTPLMISQTANSNDLQTTKSSLRSTYI